MAEHADATAGQLTGSAGAATTAGDPESKSSARKRLTAIQTAFVISAAAFVALAAVAGFLGYQIFDERQAQTQHDEFLSAASEAAISLTTVDHSTVEADIQRILDSSTGAFHEDFKNRSQPFAEVVRHAQSSSEGTVASAGVQTREGDHAEVLVVMAVKMSAEGMPEEQPRSWRMRIGVQKDGGVPKMSDVQFVQ